MKVVFVLPFFSRRPIGGLRVVYELANELVATGHTVAVVHPKVVREIARQPGIRGGISRLMDSAIAYRGVPWMKVDPRVQMLHIASIEAGSVPDADAVIATNWQTASPVARFLPCKGRKCHLVMDFYPYLAPRSTLEESWRSGFRLATISQWLREMVLKAGVNEEDVTSISCGISTTHRLKAPVEGRLPSVVIMYGLGNYKAPTDAVAAMEAVHSAMPQVPIRAFGANSSRRPRELPDWIEYLPLLSDERLSDLYNRSAVFASTSLAEGFCLPAAEAMASGCAVVATNSGGILDFAVHGQNCLLSEPGDPKALADNIVSVLNDAVARHRMARAGLACIEGFTWARSASRLEAFLASS